MPGTHDLPEPISIASISDAGGIAALLNRAYRGESSRKGWTTEADLIAGEVRADSEEVARVIGLDDSIFLVHRKHDDSLNACMNLQKKGNKVYLGMFAVEPETQNAGIGKLMLQAADAWAKQNNSISIFMMVISLREDLISWYRRRGYEMTGEIIPFEEDGKSGQHLKKLAFAILEKKL